MKFNLTLDNFSVIVLGIPMRNAMLFFQTAGA
jgi:hypothetical protein